MFLPRGRLAAFRSFSLEHGHISKGALEGPSNTIPLEISPRKRGPSPHVIFTLDPKKFAEKKQQRLHIGGQQSFIPYNSLLKQSSPVTNQAMYYDLTLRKPVTQRYPPDTKAFLYYSTSPERPRIAGELRLRVASSDDPASFESGSDLLLTNGHPWSRPLYILPKYYSPLYETLKEDRLIPDDLDTVLSTFASTVPRYRYSGNQRLYTLNDTFIVDFSYIEWSLLVITEQGVDKLRILKLFSDCRQMGEVTPYTGSAFARLERSTLPEHKGTKSVVLRFLKIITPVKCVIPLYDGYIHCPKEGELFRRTSRCDRKPNQSVWRVDIDRKQRNDSESKLRSLNILWDT